MKRSLGGCLVLVLVLACGKKSDGPRAEDISSCAATDAAYMKLAVQAGTEGAIDDLLVRGFTACAAACDAKHQPSCDVLAEKSGTWSSGAGASMKSLDALCDRSKSASLDANLCVVIRGSRK